MIVAKSAVNSLALERTFMGMLVMHARNGSGANTVAWRTSDVTDTELNCSPSTTTLCVTPYLDPGIWRRCWVSSIPLARLVIVVKNCVT